MLIDSSHRVAVESIAGLHAEIKELQAENAKLQQKVLQYSRERSEANRAELEAKQRVWVLEQENAHLREAHERMLTVLKDIYLKHQVEHPDAKGWDELGDDLHNCLTDMMGDAAYNDWLYLGEEGQGDE